MADEKRALDTPLEKHPQSIPPPVATPTPRKRCAARFAKILARCALVSLLLVAGRHWIKSTRPASEAEELAWFANPSPAKHHGHGHHTFLNGKKAEKLFLSVPNAQSALAASRQYATKPHMAGTPGDFETAKDFLALLQTEFGAVVPAEEPIYSAGTPESRNATLGIPKLNGPTAWIDVYYPYMNTPLDRSVEILDEDGKVAWSAPLEEVADDTDPEAGKYVNAVPTFHGLSRGGEVTGKLIYANYGRQEDYKALVEKGVSFDGSIVLVRYGGIFRGLKVKGAQELGAAGVLIYSDPADDGSVTVENGYLPYPHGPARNPTSVQRGSVQYLSIYPGDPTTPGYPAYENSTRSNAENIPGIPSLPLSWENAQVLLKEIAQDGKKRTVSFKNHVDDKITPIWNTMGVIPGHIKDEVVVIGNHRDAWVMGAADPSSGTASVHEVIRGFGALLRKGWKPLRTIVFASWDAEEYGLIGSTEWGEDFGDWINEHVVAYLNLDGSVSGSRFETHASPSLAHLMRSTAEQVPHPTKSGLTLWDATKDSGVLTGPVDEAVLQMYQIASQAADSLGVSPLGSGSDFTVFLQRLGVASMNHGFGSTLQDPVYHYHSVYDSQRFQELYADPGFHRHVAVAQHLGLLGLRIADSIILPLNTTHYAFELEAYLDKVESIASKTSQVFDFSSLRSSIHALQSASASLDAEKIKAEHEVKKIVRKIAHRHALRGKVRKAICKLKKVFGKKCGCPHKRQDAHAAVIETSYGVIKPRIGLFPAWVKEHNEKHSGGRDGKIHKKLAHAIKRVRAVNKKLVSFERGLIHEDGIKDREWYRHLGVAPGKWLGYGATTLPALTEAFTIERNTTLAKYEADRLEGLIEKLAQQLKA